RYFPEPDLPPLVVSDELLREVQASMPELPAARRRRYSLLGLPMPDVLQLAEEPVIARMFDGVLVGSRACPTLPNPDANPKL
ncbi:glutamyl-tRNA(Gln) amidotransferase subunit B, chloroplastic/mitochondrial, partial [Haematococcus lacustris]